MSALPVRFVLFEPTHPGNVGAAARAIKTMGFSELVIVNPGCEIDGVARARSSGALDVLIGARIVESLAGRPPPLPLPPRPGPFDRGPVGCDARRTGACGDAPG